MKHILAAAILTSAASFASEPPTPKSIVETELLGPLSAKERTQSRFSRSRMPALARQVRIVDTAPQKDGKGAAFWSFAVDAQSGYDLLAAKDNWRKNVMTGCVYPGSGTVYVLRSGAYYESGIMIGKKTKAAPAHTCAVDAEQVAAAR